jgi:hypothetical protein
VAEAGDTVAVKVTFDPAATELNELVSVVVVAVSAALTVIETAFDVLAA